MAYASTVDVEEAYQAGRKATQLAASQQSGYMATLLRDGGPQYKVRYDKVPLLEVAGSERRFPAEWISESGLDVTDDFVEYALPLLGEEMLDLPMERGRQRLTRLQPIYARQSLPSYVPEADR